MPLQQVLPEHREKCKSCIDKFTGLAKRNDPVGFTAAAAETFRQTGETADVYEWLGWKLNAGLNSWRKPGQAAYRWMVPGRIEKVLVWCSGSRESEQTSPLANPAPGEQWWPCIVLVGPGE